MQIEIASLRDGAATAGGTVVIIDVFRAFSVAAWAFRRGAEAIVMVDDIETALALKASGRGSLCIGESGGRRPEGFDFGNSPPAIAGAELTGRTLIQATTNGTRGIQAAAGGARRLYTGAFVNAAATARAILADPDASLVTLVAMGVQNRRRATEDEIFALYLRALLLGLSPDDDAVRRTVLSLAHPPDPALLASGDSNAEDRSYALDIDAADFAIRVTLEDGVPVARPERLPGQ